MAVTEEESSSSPSSSAAQSRHPSASNSGAAVHFLAKSLVRSGVILQVVRGCFRSPDSSNIVFGKETSIELVIMGDDGIVQSVCEQPVFGMIKYLAVLPWKITHVQLSDVGRMLAVDSSGSFVAVGSHEKQVTLFSMSRSYSDNVVNKMVHLMARMMNQTMARVIAISWLVVYSTTCFITQKMIVCLFIVSGAIDVSLRYDILLQAAMILVHQGQYLKGDHRKPRGNLFLVNRSKNEECRVSS
ncbi:hypothetical protein AKJ16_DCAP01442 [Drosera capensis]